MVERWRHGQRQTDGGDVPDRGDVVGMGERALDLSLREEHVEVSVLHVLRHHAQGVRVHAHTQQADDVRVVQARHDLYFLQEVIPNGGQNTNMESKHPNLIPRLTVVPVY